MLLKPLLRNALALLPSFRFTLSPCHPVTLLPLFLVALSPSLSAQVGKVGINTTTPAAMLHVADSNVLFTGPSPLPASPGGPPVTGPGTRLMWYPAKAAFRAGRVTGTQWDRDSVGIHSAGFGFNIKAKGSASFVGGGETNVASGFGSFVGGGELNVASGLRSFIGGGDENEALGSNAFVGGGAFQVASGSKAFIGGGNANEASGLNAFVGGGDSNEASGPGAFVGGGLLNEASGLISFIGGGQNLLSRSFGEAVFGLNNTDYTPVSTTTFNANDRLFVIGNGTSTSARSNAVTVLKNGRVGIGTDTPQEVLHVEGTIEVDFKIQANDADGLELASDDGTTRLKVADNGNVGINTSMPSTRIQVIAPESPTAGPILSFGGETINQVESGRIRFLEGAPGTNWRGAYIHYDGNANLMHLGVHSADNQSLADDIDIITIDRFGQEVGIGTTAPSFQLHVSTNDAGKPTSNVWSVASDARLKRNVHNYTDGLEALMRVRPVWFTYTGEAGMPDDTGVGVIAQELQEVAPYMVGTWTHEANGQKTEYLSVDNGAMTYMLINAVKEQQAIIEELKSANDAQATRLNAMEQELADIKAMLTARPATAITTAQVAD